MSYYRDVVIQTYRNPGEPSNMSVRARPLPGQGLSPNLNVECSSKMREQNPDGTLFIVRLKITDREGTSFLYTYHGWKYQIVTLEEAERFIRERYQTSAVIT